MSRDVSEKFAHGRQRLICAGAWFECK